LSSASVREEGGLLLAGKDAIQIRNVAVIDTDEGKSSASTEVQMFAKFMKHVFQNSKIFI
jgi:hypothetical protein